jgi:hypothetical protein
MISANVMFWGKRNLNAEQRQEIDLRGQADAEPDDNIDHTLDE